MGELATKAKEKLSPAAGRLTVVPAPSVNGLPELLVESLAGCRPRPVLWNVPGLIPAGMLVLGAGEGGKGKTVTTLELAAALSVGRCAFGLSYPDPPRGSSLLVSCEDDWERTTVPRLAALGADLSQVLRVKGVRMKPGLDLLDFHLGHFQELERLLVKRPDIRLIVVDPAGAYVGRAGVNENRDAELRSLLGPLSEIANRTLATVFLVKHLNKSAGVSAVQRVSGSTGYVNAVRAAFLFGDDPTFPDRKVMVPIKANVLPAGTKGLAYRLASIPEPEARALLLARWQGLDRGELDALSKQLFRPQWEHDVSADADAVSGRRASSRDDVAGCAAFIRTFLGDSSWPDKELQLAVENAGFSFRVYKTTKAQMRTPDKTDPQRLSSSPRGEGGPWWCWIGRQREPAPDRRASHTDQTDHTDHTDQTEIPL